VILPGHSTHFPLTTQVVCDLHDPPPDARPDPLTQVIEIVAKLPPEHQDRLIVALGAYFGFEYEQTDS
jgi:hypothetical protein